MYYKDLTDAEVTNLSYLLEYANRFQMDILQQRYPNIIKRHKLEFYRNNIMQSIMHNTIKIENIINWLCQLKANCANTIIHLEFNSKNYSKLIFSNDTITKLNNIQKNILSFSKDSIKNIELIELSNSINEIELSLILPSTKIIETDATDLQGKVYHKENAFYFAYVWINRIDGSITFSLPSFAGYESINGNNKKRSFLDSTVKSLIKYFKEQIIDIDFLDTDWVTVALRKITDEYYSHNNPIIEKEMKKIKLKFNDDKNQPTSIINQISALSDTLNNDICVRRIQKSLETAIEKELIAQYGLKPCKHPFEVFLHEVDKGPTTFKSRKGNVLEDEKVLPEIDTRDIIIKMLELSSIKAIGLKYINSDSSVSYKITCTEDWFMLEQTNDTNTSKELVKDVLSAFKRYKLKGHSKFKRTADN